MCVLTLSLPSSLPSTSLPSLLPQTLSDQDYERDEQINDIIGSFADDWKLKEAQVKAITSAKGEKKAAALSAAIRGMQFMARYESEMSQRDDKLLVSWGLGLDWSWICISSPPLLSFPP